MRIAVVLALLTACGRYGFDESAPDAALPPVVPAPAQYASGTRLRAEAHDVAGTKMFATWFDTLLGEECARRVTEDGVMRCIPTRIATGAQYSDSTCATHLLSSIQPSDPTDCPSALVLESQQVGERYRVVQVGAKDFGTVYQDSNGSCTMVGTSASIDYYALFVTTRGERCQLEMLAWNQMGCVPKSAHGFLGYADATCTRRSAMRARSAIQRWSHRSA